MAIVSQYLFSRFGHEENISLLSGWRSIEDRPAELSNYNSETVFLAEEKARYSNFCELTRDALTAYGRTGAWDKSEKRMQGSDINIVLPKRNTLSRGKFPSGDQGSKLLKSFPRCYRLRGLCYRATRVSFLKKKWGEEKNEGSREGYERKMELTGNPCTQFKSREESDFLFFMIFLFQITENRR